MIIWYIRYDRLTIIIIIIIGSSSTGNDRSTLLRECLCFGHWPAWCDIPCLVIDGTEREREKVAHTRRTREQSRAEQQSLRCLRLRVPNWDDEWPICLGTVCSAPHTLCCSVDQLLMSVCLCPCLCLFVGSKHSLEPGWAQSSLFPAVSFSPAVGRSAASNHHLSAEAVAGTANWFSTYGTDTLPLLSFSLRWSHFGKELVSPTFILWCVNAYIVVSCRSP